MGIFFGKGDFARPTLASASTCDLFAIDDHFVEITGTVPITSFGTHPLLWKDIYATAGFTLTNNAAIVTGTGGDIAVGAGDHFSVLSNGAGVFKVISYRRASGKSLTGPAAADISDATAAGRSVLTAINAAAQRTAMALGGAAVLNVGTTTGTVMAGDDSRIAGAAQLAGATFTGAVALAADPSSSLQAATKQYVDNVAAGLSVKPSALCATTANITLSGEQTIDTVTTSASIVAVKNQSTAAQNGLYRSAAGAWTRIPEMDSWAEVPGAHVWIEQGAVNGDTAWVCTSDPGGTLGTTAINWTQYGGTGAFAPLNSPAFTGTPTVPTAAVDTATTQAASAAFVLNQAAAATPLINGTAAVGTATRFARADHVHPTDSALFRHPGYVAARWYWAVKALVAAGSASGVNTIKLLPFYLPMAVTMSDLGAKVSTADASGNFQLAVYNSDPTTHAPTTLAAATGNISTASAVVVSADITGANVTLQPGLYWAASNTNSTTAAFLSIHPSETLPNWMYGTATLANLVSGTTPLLMHTFSQTFGTWPDLTGQTLSEAAGATGAALAFKAA